jgi:hypothetical protein
VRRWTSGARTLKDAMNEALRDWVANVHDTFYIIGTVAGPHPYPELVRDFQSVIGKEARAQMLQPRAACPICWSRRRRRIERHRPVPPLPRRYRCRDARRRGGGHGSTTGSMPRASRAARPACSTATRPILLQDEDGQITEAHSISAGLDYPGIGPEHAWLHEIGRARYVSVTDDEALEAFQLLCAAGRHHPRAGKRHALAAIEKIAPTDGQGQDHRRQPVGPRRQGHLHRRQGAGGEKVIGPYIVDFASRDPMLVIEVDGDSHSSQIDYDTERTAYLQTQGYRVIRFSNTDIMGNIEGVLSVVQTMIATPPLPSLSPEGERV